MPIEGLFTVGLEQIHLSPLRPEGASVTIDPNLYQLVSEAGVISPLVVRPSPGQQRMYELVTGEGFWRIARELGLLDVPVYILNDLDDTATALAIQVELNRAGQVDPLADSTAVQTFKSKGYTDKAIGALLQRPRHQVTQARRLINLGVPARQALHQGDITVGHARVLASVKSPDRQQAFLNQVLSESLSVRQTEARLAQYKQYKPKRRPPSMATHRAASKTITKSPDVRRLEMDLADAVGCPVSLEETNDRGGRLCITYSDYEVLDGLIERMTKAPL